MRIPTYRKTQSKRRKIPFFLFMFVCLLHCSAFDRYDLVTTRYITQIKQEKFIIPYIKLILMRLSLISRQLQRKIQPLFLKLLLQMESILKTLFISVRLTTHYSFQTPDKELHFITEPKKELFSHIPPTSHSSIYGH